MCWSSIIIDMADKSGWITCPDLIGRDAFTNQWPRTNNRVSTDADAFKNGGVRSNENIILDQHRSRFGEGIIFNMGGTNVWVQTMEIRVVDSRVVTDTHIITNGNLFCADDRRAAHAHIVPDSQAGTFTHHEETRLLPTNERVAAGVHHKPIAYSDVSLQVIVDDRDATSNEISLEINAINLEQYVRIKFRITNVNRCDSQFPDFTGYS